MNKTGPVVHVVLPLLAVVALVVASCQVTKPADLSPATRPATQAASAPADQDPALGLLTLKPEALVPFDQLKPELAKPVNPPHLTTQPTDRAAALVADAQKKLAQKQYTLARDLLDRAVGFDPENPIIRRNLGEAYAGLGNAGKAKANLRLAARSMPDDLKTHLLLGSLAFEDDPDEAIASLRLALKTSQANGAEPMAAEALWLLAKSLESRGYSMAALECYDRLSTWIDEHGDAYTASPLLGPLLLRPEALMIRRASVLLDLNRAKEAIEPLSKVYERDRSSVIVARLLVQALITDRRYAQAEKIILEMAPQPGVQGQVAPLTAVLARVSGNKRLPCKMWQASLSGNKVDALLALAMARVCLELKDPAQAEEILKSVLERMPNQTEASKMLASVYQDQGKHELALRQLASLLAADSGEAMEVIRLVKAQAAASPPELAQSFAKSIDSQTDKSAAPLHLVAGHLAAARGQIKLAARQYQLALEKDPAFLPSYDSMLEIYIRQRDRAGMAALQAKLAKQGPDADYFKSYIAGVIKLAAGDAQAAAALLEKARSEARAADKRFSRILVLLARSLNLSGRGEEATSVMMDAVAAEGDNEPLYRELGLLLMAQGRHDDVQRVIKLLTDRQPHSVVAKIMQAELYLKTDKKDQGAALVAQLRKSAPNNLDVQVLDFKLQYGGRLKTLKKEEFADAVARLCAIFKLDPSNDSVLGTLEQLLDAPAHRSEAAEIFGKLYEQTGKPIGVARAYANALLRTQQYDKAAEILRDLLQDNPDDVRLRLMLLDSLTKLKKTDDVIALAKGYLQQAPDDESRLVYRQRLLKLYEENKKYDDAQALLDDWIKLNADDQQVQGLKGSKLGLFTKAKQYERAVDFGRQWIKDLQDDRNESMANAVRGLLVQELAAAKQHDAALTILNEWIGDKTDASVDRLRRLKILLLGEAGKVDEAAKVADGWISAEPGAWIPRQALLGAMIQAKQYKQASERADQWLSQSDPAHAFVVGDAATTKPAFADTVKVPLAGAGVDSLRLMSVTLMHADGKYKEALLRADRYLAVYRERPFKEGSDPEGELTNPVVRLYDLKASSYSELGQADQAVKSLEKGYELYPEDPGVNNDLGYMYADRGINLEKAEKMIRMALAVQGNSAALQDSLAWVFYKQARFDDAARIFESIVEGDEAQRPEHSVIYDHTGDTFYRLGDNAKAVQYWTIALEKAKAEKPQGREAKAVLADTPGKIAAAKASKPAKVADLGKDVKAE